MVRHDSLKMALPAPLAGMLNQAKSVREFDTTDALLALALGDTGGDQFEVAFDLPNGKRVVEAHVARLRNGIAVNFPEPYMRRRDPNCMFVADALPTDKPRFQDRFGYPFSDLRQETIDWLQTQDLGVFAFSPGRPPLDLRAVAVFPLNTGFFALGLALLQGIVPLAELPSPFSPGAILYVAPPFRHTHFQGRQAVVHDRTDGAVHEMFAYNLYPGPSAKKGVYSVLIDHAEKEGWVVPHCSAVRVITPYDNETIMMHEGASGGGKSEMLEQMHRESDGRLLLGRNLVTDERRYLEVPRACALRPVADDMALCPASLQQDDGYLRLIDAETAWFIRVNHIREYGTDPYLEKLTSRPEEPLVFLNIDAEPRSRAMIWEHTEDAPGKPCPNPRVILPRRLVPQVIDEPVTVDIRGFGVRTPPCTRENPSYGILGLFHLLPPALAWLWRLVSPRGYANPSILQTEDMGSDGVGSYWPFATGRFVTQANLLLAQIERSLNVRYILCPNQHVGAWECGFMPQWITREYLARRGHAHFKPDQIQPARCSLLGYAMYQLQIEGRMVPRWFLQVDSQPEVGPEAYDRGAEILRDFFRAQLHPFLQADLSPLGKRIIECCLDGGAVAEYEALLPVASGPRG